MISEHTEDCLGGDECEPNEGQWLQPPGMWVTVARDELDSDAPWCQIHHLVWELAEAEDGEEGE